MKLNDELKNYQKNTLVVVALGLAVVLAVVGKYEKQGHKTLVLGESTAVEMSESTTTPDVSENGLPEESTTTPTETTVPAEASSTTIDSDAASEPSSGSNQAIPIPSPVPYTAPAQSQIAQQQPPMPKNPRRDFITADGLEVTVRREGTGTQSAATGDNVKIQYEETIVGDRERLDPTNTKGEAFIFRLGSSQVISGWNLGITGMKVGEVREIYIPAEMAYGTAGNKDLGVPPLTPLTLRVVLLKIN